MPKSKAKTIETVKSVSDFIDTVSDEQKRDDCFAMIEIMKAASGIEPKMWGPAIVGFGKYHYVYESGHEGDAPLAAFSPRKDSLVLYLASSFPEKEELLKQLGKHKAAKACVYIKKLEDVDKSVLKMLVTKSIKQVRSLYK
jgi:hypothetical protein